MHGGEEHQRLGEEAYKLYEDLGFTYEEVRIITNKYMYRLSEEERKELLEITRENNRLLKSILTIVTNEHSSDFINNIVANIIGNGIIPNRR